MSIADSSVLVVEPIENSLSRVIRERLQRRPGFRRMSTEIGVSQMVEQANGKTRNTDESASIQYLFGNPWWMSNKRQQLKKSRINGHAISSNGPDALKSVLCRAKRLHALSLLRGYNMPNAYSSYSAAVAPTPSHRKNSDLVRVLSRRKRLHALSTLRRYNTRRPLEETRLQWVLRRSRRSLHNLSLLRGYGNARAAARGVYMVPRLDNIKNQPLGWKSKRVHSLSLLRYDGKLFQNLYSPQDAEFQQKRFQQGPYY